MYCLRCGRQIAEGASFCDACAETVAKPLEESPFLSTRIILPARRTARPAPKPLPEKKKKKGSDDAPGKPGRLIAAVVLLSVCCVLLTAACGYGAKLWFDGRREHNTLLAAQEENTRLQSQLAQKDEELRAQQDKVSQLSARLDEAAQRLLWVGIAFTIPHPRRAGKSFLRRPAKRAEIPLHPAKNIVE